MPWKPKVDDDNLEKTTFVDAKSPIQVLRRNDRVESASWMKTPYAKITLEREFNPNQDKRNAESKKKCT